MYDWPNAVGSNNCPNEKGNSCSGHNIGLDCKKVADLVNWKPDSRERAKPENEERNKADGVSPRVGDPVMDTVLIPRRPNSSNHKLYAFSTNPCLNTVPDAGHCCPVENRPQSSPYSKTSAGDDRERDVICCSDSTSEDNETSCDSVTQPDTDP